MPRTYRGGVMVQFFTYYGEKYRTESGGRLGSLVNKELPFDATWDDVKRALAAGDDISIRAATPLELFQADLLLDELLDRQSEADPKKCYLTIEG
jgi:hypothetical protein